MRRYGLDPEPLPDQAGVVINPSNTTGAVRPGEILDGITTSPADTT
ncbi:MULTISPECIES: hypothetical protein [Streptomyces]